MAAPPPSIPPGAKLVSFKKTVTGEYVDQEGKKIEMETLRQSYKQNEKGELVDKRGKVVTEVKAIVEDVIEDVSVYEDDEEALEDAASDDPLDHTLLCGDDEAEGIAINRVLQRMIRQHGEEAVSIENIWLYFLELMEEENFSKAFEVLLRFGDDFYFLRACVMSGGQILKKLNKRVGQRVLKRICQIKLAGNLDTTSLHFIERGVRNNYLDRVDFETSNGCLQALSNISQNFNNAVKERALYLADLVEKLLDYN